MFLKDADAVIDYRVDWSAAVGEGESIASSSWSVRPLEPGGISVESGVLEDKLAVVRLGGGIAGHVYRVGNRVTFSDGRVEERSLAIRVEQR